MKKIGDILIKVITVTVLVVTVLIGVLFKKEGLWGYRAFVVSSGSMTPSLPISSLIIVKAQTNYQKDDIITFYTADSNGIRQPLPTTHRVYAVQEGTNLGYQTKGDANNIPDPVINPANAVIGKLVFFIPYLGKFTDFIRSRNGLIFLIIIPGTILAYQEFLNLRSETQKIWEKRKTKKNKISIKIPENFYDKYKGIIKFVLIFGLFLMTATPIKAFFGDQEKSTNNSVSTGIVDLKINSQIGTSININELKNGDNFEYNFDLSKSEKSSALKYMISFVGRGETTLCSLINLKINVGATTIYDSPLNSLDKFSAAELIIPDNLVYNLKFQYSLPVDLKEEYLNAKCDFKYVFRGWDKDLASPSESFNDDEEASFSFSTKTSPPLLMVVAAEATPTPELEPTPTPIPEATATPTVIPENEIP